MTPQEMRAMEITIACLKTGARIPTRHNLYQFIDLDETFFPASSLGSQEVCIVLQIPNNSGSLEIRAVVFSPEKELGQATITVVGATDQSYFRWSRQATYFDVELIPLLNKVSILWNGGWDDYVVDPSSVREMSPAEKSERKIWPTIVLPDHTEWLKGTFLESNRNQAVATVGPTQCLRIVRHLAGGD